MDKKKTANLIMVAVILVIVFAGIFFVGHIQGWFDRNADTGAKLMGVRGVIFMERDGASYQVREDTLLRKNDKISCNSGATGKISLPEGYLSLGENTQIQIVNDAQDRFEADVFKGEIFVNAADSVSVSLDGQNVNFENTAALVSVHTGAKSVGVLAGSVEDAAAGQLIEWVGKSKSLREFSIESLNKFAISQIRLAGENLTLCFSNQDLDDLEQNRKIQLEHEKETEPAETSETVKPTESEQSETVPSQNTEDLTESEPAQTETPEQYEPTYVETEEPSAEESEQEQKLVCTLSIRCDTILDNWENLDPAKAGYVPEDGAILYAEVEFNQGDTAFDVLKKACADYGIQLEYSWTPMYDSYYVEGINNLYEFDCGGESGWMYQVNGWFPNYGCSDYELQDGDVMNWLYTCNGLGADLGGSVG